MREGKHNYFLKYIKPTIQCGVMVCGYGCQEEKVACN